MASAIENVLDKNFSRLGLSESELQIVKTELIAFDAYDVNVCLSGAFPTPEYYIGAKYNGVKTLSREQCHEIAHLELVKFLNMDACQSMYSDMITACKQAKVTKLIIDASPVSFASLKDVLGEHFLHVVRDYSQQAALQLEALLKPLLKDTVPNLSVILVLPTEEQIMKFSNSSSPTNILSQMVDGFPTLKISNPSNSSFYILDNTGFSTEAEQMDQLFAKKYPEVKAFKSIDFYNSSNLWTYKPIN